MRILFVNKFLYPRGGSESYMFGLTDYLMQHGHDIEFFGMADDRNVVAASDRRLVRNLDFHSSSIDRVTYPLRVIYSGEARRKIRWYLNSFKPDIVHIGIFNFQLTPSIIYEIRAHGIPMVHTVHDAAMVCPSHLLFNVSTNQVCERCIGGHYLSCATTKCIHGSFLKSVIGALEGYLYRGLRSYRHIDRLICPSQFYADKLVQSGVDRRQIAVIPNAVSASERAAPGSLGDYVLYFGRLSREKGIATLVDACSMLPHIRFLVAGDGPLSEQAAGCTNVELVGFKQGDELRGLVRESLFTVYPSEWYENCPMSILESIAFGRPVVGSRIGGIPELVDDGSDGLLFEPGSADDLAKKIRLLYEDRRLLSEFSDRLVRKAKRYSIEAYYARLMEVYGEAMRSHATAA